MAIFASLGSPRANGAKLVMESRKDSEYPEGTDFLEFARSHQDKCESRTDSLLPEVGGNSAETLDRLGTVLSLLNRVATCHWGCHEREHTLEYLAGWATSSALAALRLTKYGHYDEAISLIRSIAELGNLLQLFLSDIEHFEEWKSLPEKKRVRQFSPGRVRKKLEESDAVVPTDREKYSTMCERGVHATPGTIPQNHDSELNPTLGGYYQEEGLKICLNELSWSTATVSGPLAKLAILERERAEQIVEASVSLAEEIGSTHLK